GSGRRDLTLDLLVPKWFKETTSYDRVALRTRRATMSGKMVISGAALVLLVGCVGDQSLPAGFEVRAPLFAAVGPAGESHLRTHVAGGNEVFTPGHPGDPTPADSRAQGEAIFRVSADGSTVEFRLIASNI